MNRRDFIKSASASAAALTVAPAVIASERGGIVPKLKYPYFVNCYIQNQRYWPLEEYKKGMFGGSTVGIKDEGYMGEKWINGQLRFYGFRRAVDFIETHSRVVSFQHEIAYEVFHERSEDPLVPPKHIYNYWSKISPLKEIQWIHPDYIDHTADGALIEYV